MSCLWRGRGGGEGGGWIYWNIVVAVSYCQGRPRLELVNRLEDLSLPRNSTTYNWPARYDLVVDWAVKLQHKQNILEQMVCLENKVLMQIFCINLSFFL